MRKKWTPGDPCPECDTPLWAESDRYKPGRAICRTCGLLERRAEQAAARTRTAKPCRVCAAVLAGNDIHQGACKPCRVAAAEAANAARRCPCGASIAHRSKNARFCEQCSTRQTAKGATAGSAAAMEKRRKVLKVPIEAEQPRPYHAPDGLRGGRYPALSAIEGEAVCPKHAAAVDAILSRRWATRDGGRV